MRDFVIIFVVLLLAGTVTARAAENSKEGVEFFEKNIRPVLVQQCYECHSSGANKIKGKLVLDSRQGIARGGDNGAVIEAGNPDGSRLITAIRWSDTELQMPPKKKLSAQ